MLPGGSPMGLFHDDYEKSVGLFTPYTTILSITSLITILMISLLFRNTRLGFVFFGLVFFLCGHLVESTFIPLELYFEHRNYLPSIGLYFSLAVAIGFLSAKQKYRKASIFFVVLLSLLFSISTYYRVTIWESIGSILHASVNSHPESWRTHTRLANLSIMNGEIEIAREHLTRAVQIDKYKGKYGIVLSQLIAHCFDENYPDEVLYSKLENTELMDDTYTFSILRWLNQLLEDGECKNLDKRKIVNTIAASLENDTKVKGYVKDWELYLYVGKLYSSLKEYEKAIYHYARSYDLNPAYYDSAILALELKIKLFDYVSAEKILTKVEKNDAYKYEYQREWFANIKDLLADRDY